MKEYMFCRTDAKFYADFGNDEEAKKHALENPGIIAVLDVNSKIIWKESELYALYDFTRESPDHYEIRRFLLPGKSGESFRLIPDDKPMIRSKSLRECKEFARERKFISIGRTNQDAKIILDVFVPSKQLENVTVCTAENAGVAGQV